jgi:hypothetical protein
MLSWVVNYRPHPRRAIRPPDFRHGDENQATIGPLNQALTNRDAHNPFRICFYENCRVSPTSPLKNFKSYLRFPSSRCPLRSLFSLFTPRAFHKSFALKRLRTLSENSRGVPRLLPQWNSLALQPTPPLRSSIHQSPITSHPYRLTPSASADSINLHPAERFFTRQSRPPGGGIP